MSRPIKVTENMVYEIMEDFQASLKDSKMFNGEVSYKKVFRWKDSSENIAYIHFSTAAFSKMISLLMGFDTEVGWHGVVERDPDMENRFLIKDILVYPQDVDGASIDPDQIEYQNWQDTLSDDVFNRMRLHGHSHVNFSVGPSKVDTDYQEKILSQMDDNMFYIFMIWNKKMDNYAKIYDIKNNILFENEDIQMFISDDDVDLDSFMKDAKNIVRKKKCKAKSTSKAGKTSASCKKSSYNDIFDEDYYEYYGEV